MQKDPHCCCVDPTLSGDRSKNSYTDVNGGGSKPGGMERGVCHNEECLDYTKMQDKGNPHNDVHVRITPCGVLKRLCKLQVFLFLAFLSPFFMVASFLFRLCRLSLTSSLFHYISSFLHHSCLHSIFFRLFPLILHYLSVFTSFFLPTLLCFS